MALIEWEAKYSVGIKSIDDQHKVLIALINKLHGAMRDKTAREAVGGIVAELMDYTKTHFGFEQNLFTLHGYPETEWHLKAHGKFLSRIAEFQEGFDKKQIGLSVEILDFLSSWLLDHIQGTDKEYTAFFISKGVQ